MQLLLSPSTGAPFTTANRAFTLIELMVVVAIVAVLASFGMPAYQDYIRKTRVAETLQLMSAVKMQIVDNAVNGRPFNEAVNMPGPTSYFRAASIDPTYGFITVTFKPEKFNGINYYITLFPKDAGASGTVIADLWGTATSSVIPAGAIRWSCRSAATTGPWAKGNMPGQYVPESCKGDAYN